jgi:hypothetical protein
MLHSASGGGIVPVTKSLNRLAKVSQQMLPICDLDGAGRALTDPVGIRPGTIAGDDFDAGPITQPGGDGGSFAVWKEIDHFVRLEVHQHRAVAATASPSPIVDAEDARHRRNLGETAAGRETQQGIGTCRAEMRAAIRAPASPPRARPIWC